MKSKYGKRVVYFKIKDVEIMVFFGWVAVAVALAFMGLFLRFGSVPKKILLRMDESNDDADMKIVGGSVGLPGANDDADMKIAGENIAPEIELDADEKAAEIFLQNKEVGNIAIANQVGISLANLLWQEAQMLIMEDSGLPAQRVHQMLVLCSFVVNKVIGENSPNTLLAQTALSKFYSTTEERSSVLYQHISDTASFSLYILYERTGNGGDDVGEIYADLCGVEKDKNLIREGDSLYTAFYDTCYQQFKQEANYKVVS